jgi:pimeloyl-ACP methyl ester carboxylesterase
MTVNAATPPRPAGRGRVIALHCSGANGGEWRALEEALGNRYEVLTPEHYGCGSTEPWPGEHVFALADEAARALALLEQTEGKVHLVGHSYGAGVALNVALARPERLASLALYEPASFHLLGQMGERAAEAYAEVTGAASSIVSGIVNGDYRGSVTSFVDYWNGPGAWSALRPSLQSALIRWAPKGPLEFHALLHDPTPAEAYRAVDVPALILRGEHGPMPTRVIAESLSTLLPSCRVAVVDGAGHMGPVTHAAAVSELIVRHIAEVDAGARRPRPWHPLTFVQILTAPPRPGGGSS